MLLNPSRFGGGAPPGPFLVDAAQFDGTNDYMTRGGGLTGAVDSRLGTLVMWFNAGTWQRNDRFLQHTENGQHIYMETAPNRVLIRLPDPGGQVRLRMETNELATGVGYCLMASWDLADTARRHLYIGDANHLNVLTYSNAALDYTAANWAWGATTSGGAKANVQLAECWLDFGTYLAFSNVATRRLFYSADGKPVFLGTNGSIPTGTAPIAYHHLDAGEAPANFALNRGTGGNFSVTGALTTGAWSPSD